MQIQKKLTLIPQRMLESRMLCRWVDHVTSTRLQNIVQTVELRRVDDFAAAEKGRRGISQETGVIKMDLRLVQLDLVFTHRRVREGRRLKATEKAVLASHCRNSNYHVLSLACYIHLSDSIALPLLPVNHSCTFNTRQITICLTSRTLQCGYYVDGDSLPVWFFFLRQPAACKTDAPDAKEMLSLVVQRDVNDTSTFCQ